MGFLNKIFNIKKKSRNAKTDKGNYMPEMELPIDEKFTVTFKKNGGKFLYCGSLDEVYQHFIAILLENKWQGTKMLCYNQSLQKKFENFDIQYTENNDEPADSFFTTCEYLIASNGAILISSNQIKEKTLKELPDNFIIFATTSQLVDIIGEGLRGIKNKYQGKIPSNITTIKHFEIKEEKDFLTYGSSSKNLYLLLLEDL